MKCVNVKWSPTQWQTRECGQCSVLTNANECSEEDLIGTAEGSFWSWETLFPLFLSLGPWNPSHFTADLRNCWFSLKNLMNRGKTRQISDRIFVLSSPKEIICGKLLEITWISNSLYKVLRFNFDSNKSVNETRWYWVNQTLRFDQRNS